MAEWIVDGRARAWTSGTWTSAGSAAQYRSPSYTLARAVENYQTYYDIRYPGHERSAGRPLRGLPGVRLARRARRRCSARRRAGSGSTTTRATPQPAATSQRPRGWAGRNWSPAIAAEHRATRASGGPVRRDRRSPRSRSPGRTRPTLLEWVCDNGSPARSARSPTPRRSTAAAASSATSPSPGGPSDEFLIVTGTAFGSHDLALAAQAGRGCAAPTCASPTSPASTPASRCGARAPATSWRPLTPPTSLAAFPFMTSREITVGDVPVLALRVTFVGELGWELYCSSEYGLALWQALWRPGSRTGCWPAATGRSTACAWRRATASGAPTSTPRDDPVRGRAGLLRQAGQGRFLGQGRAATRDPAAPAALPDARRPARASRSATSRYAIDGQVVAA